MQTPLSCWIVGLAGTFSRITSTLIQEFIMNRISNFFRSLFSGENKLANARYALFTLRNGGNLDSYDKLLEALKAADASPWDIDASDKELDGYHRRLTREWASFKLAGLLSSGYSVGTRNIKETEDILARLKTAGVSIWDCRGGNQEELDVYLRGAHNLAAREILRIGDSRPAAERIAQVRFHLKAAGNTPEDIGTSESELDARSRLN